jgi:YegS/Rv2252/BmrU family lipid kinase
MSSIRNEPKQAFIVINPASGIGNGITIKNICKQQFARAGWTCSFHMTLKGENTAPLVKKAVDDGADLVVAVGGDGTIAAVAAGLVDSEVPLGIIPSGTWNAIARHLYIPFNTIRAIALMTGKHTIREMDMMSVGDSYHAMNLSVGFSAKMNENASREIKKKIGALAYIRHFFNLIFGLEMQRYVVQADGFTYRGRASEIFIANYGVAGLHILEDRLDIHPDDGKVDVLIIRARTLLDMPALLWQMLIRKDKRTPKYRQFTASNTVTISTYPPSLVQADGELIGMTPVNITVLPRKIKVIAPLPAPIILPQFLQS